MGLDITVLGKPLPGHEAEFHDLSIALSISNGVRQGDRPRPSFWKYLLGMAPPQISKTEIAAKTDRFNAISTPPYAVLDAPVVGQDAAADAWVRERAAAAGKSPEQMLAEHAHRYALANGLVAQLGQRRVDWQDETSPQAQLHIVDSLARWAMFWGSRGHGAYPDF